MNTANFDLIFDQWYDEINTLLNPTEFLFEVVLERSPYLKVMDASFRKLRKNNRDRKALKELADAIVNFTKIKNITVEISGHADNMSVIPIYTRNLAIDMNVFKAANKAFSGEKEKIKVPQTIEESIKYVDRVYIFINDEFVKEFSSRQLTAVLLHELGHIFAHTSNFLGIFSSLIKKMSFGGSALSLIFGVATTSLITIPISLLLFTIGRSLTFLDHREEFGADSYAIKYGYGEELAKVLDRFRDVRVNKRSFWKKVFEWIKVLLFPGTHPEDEKRICQIFDKMKKEYKNLYPKLNKELTIILSDLKC